MKNEGHAVLTVTTDAGDYVWTTALTKSRAGMTPITNTEAVHANPLQWVALIKQSTSSGFVASGN
jgi:predicted transglutaminase-like cysteine proteinase